MPSNIQSSLLNLLAVEYNLKNYLPAKSISNCKRKIGHKFDWSIFNDEKVLEGKWFVILKVF